MKNLEEILKEIKDESVREKIKELYKSFQKVESKGGLYVTYFLSLSEQYYFQKLGHLFNNLYTLLSGGVVGVERKRGFIADSLELIEYIDLDKYFVGLSFRILENKTLNNLLESLKNKGIDESKIGDIWNYQGNWNMIIAKEVLDNMAEDLKNECIEFKIMNITDMKDYIRPSKILRTTENSKRLDAIGSFAFGISRSKMQDYIKAGIVDVNGKNVKEVYYDFKEGDVVTIPGLGSFKINKVVITSKGRYHVEIERILRR